MPSIRYINQSAPFWDFVASMENNHPRAPAGESSEEDDIPQHPGPWGAPWGPWGGHRGRHGHHGPPGHRGPPHGHHGHHGPHPHPPHPPHPPPPPGQPEDGSMPPPNYEDSPDTAMGDVNEKGEKMDNDKNAEETGEAGPSTRREGGRCSGRWGRKGGCGGDSRRGGTWGGRGRHHHAGPEGPGGPSPWGQRGGPFAFGGGPFGPIGDFMRDQFFGTGHKEGEQQGDFKPELDVFDTETSFVVHISLPGAKKEDVGVNWDPEKSELSIAGVIYRPGDEDFIKTLAMDGRKIGPFEAKVRLGSRANPAQIEVDGITAKLEDGILIVEVPKQDKDYVEVKKVDIE